MFRVPFETERFVIRRFAAKDLDAFLAFMLDPESTRYLAFEEEQKTEAGARALFDYVVAAYDTADPVHSYVIAEKGSDRYLGSCGFSPYAEGIFECYYSVNVDERGQGVAAEATRAMAQELAKQVEVRAYCHLKNHAAHAVAKKAGFIPHGMQMHNVFGFAGELFIFPRQD